VIRDLGHKLIHWEGFEMAGNVRRALHAGMLVALASCSGASFTLGDDVDAASGALPDGAGADAAGHPGDAAATDGGVPAVTPDQACLDLATAGCKRVAFCAPALVTLGYGDLATCVARTRLACSISIAAPGTGITPSNAEDCAKASETATCDDLLDNNPPRACVAAGTVLAGGVCGDTSQCGAGGFCNVAAGQACGVCGARVGGGGSCRSTAECQAGLTCTVPASASIGTCVAPGGPGGACDATHPCQASLACTSNTCGTPLGAGVACTTPNCDTLNGLYCSPQSHVCAQATIAGPGAACGVSLTAATVAVCGAGGRCKTSGTSTSGTCQAAAADGKSCDSVNGPFCLTPARCANGVCVLPAPSSCH
jgi:hypothetical protein